MNRYLCLACLVLPNLCRGENVKTLVLEGTSTEAISLKIVAASVLCPPDIVSPQYQLTASPPTGTTALDIRNLLVAETGKRTGICLATDVVTDATRIHIGATPAIRFASSINYQNGNGDFQLWLSTDGMNFVLLEPQVPVMIGGVTFRVSLGDPQAVSPAPAIGIIGFGILTAGLLGIGVVVSRRRIGTNPIGSKHIE